MKSLFSSVVLLTTTCVLFLSGCKKDDAAPASKSFSPLTVGTNWNYNYVENGNTSNFTVTVSNLADTTVASGRKYKILNNSEGGHNYLSQSGNDYYRFASFPALGIDNFEELYLKDNEAINGTWKNTTTFTLPGNPFVLTADLTYKIAEKGITRVVGANTYSNVTHVHVDFKITIAGNVGGGEFYYAEGIGLIEDQIDISVTGQPPYNSKQTLVSYEIK